MNLQLLGASCNWVIYHQLTCYIHTIFIALCNFVEGGGTQAQLPTPLPINGSELQLSELMDEVAAQIPTKWYFFGMEIGIPKETLDLIEQNHSKDQLRCFLEVASVWKNQVTEKIYSWSSVLKILRAPSINECKIADKLEIKLAQ